MSLVWRHSILPGLVILCTATSAPATEVNVVGLFSGKAMVSINGGKHRVMTAGETTPEGVKLISADSSTAVLEIDGKRQNLGMGKSASIPSADGGGNQSAVLAADVQGHFVTTGNINGTGTRMMVDTGASMVSMGKDEAKRLGISYLNGERGMVSTANGVVPAYHVTLNTVRVGNLTLNQVDGLVQESNMPYVLLGMSFLKRLEIKQDGTNMTLLKKY
ncbi:retropepsin-like aspartic protease family protein [Sulfuricella sp.]|uniref:retropepsin-like aspartic protease family protein n=1 Tax=Sulfuricella sp. TaxID=2099377 RepID=UPI002C0B8077|nr:TIGR02281 family clan AA aspartic protease [Sulfuricella sp.]HUX63150.1 TIGR02281 family clan AA aspartic protease [Sulfuricella sp.]